MENIVKNFIDINQVNGYKAHEIYYEIMIVSYLAKLSIENNKTFDFTNKDLYLNSLKNAAEQMEDSLDKDVVVALISYDYIYCNSFVHQFYLSLIANKQIITSKEIDNLLENGKELNEVYQLAFDILTKDKKKAIILDCCCQNDMFLRLADEYQLKGFASNDLMTILTTLQLRLCNKESDIKELDIVNDYYDGEFDYIFGDMHKFSYDEKACPINEEIFMQGMSLWPNIARLYSLLSSEGRMVFFVPSVVLDHLRGMNIRDNLLLDKALEKVIFLPRKYAINKDFDCALMIFSRGNKEVTFIDARKHDDLSNVFNGDTKVIRFNEIESLRVFD